ncbi:MAG: collagen-like protein [Aureibaculum sp.]|nr:collagen-like protein [Aureibaculum sp.]
MKKLSLFLLCSVVMFMSCEGPQGPPGFDGFDGANGLIGTIFEVEATFAPDGYEYLVDIPVEIEVFDTDIVMAYVLSGVDNDLDIWEPLPQTLFFGNEILLYGYDHTLADVRFFLDGTIDLNSLEALYTDNIVFRVAVIPAAFAESIDVLNINEVMDAMQLKSVKRIK